MPMEALLAVQRGGRTSLWVFRERVDKQSTSVIVPAALSIVIYGPYTFFPGKRHHWLWHSGALFLPGRRDGATQYVLSQLGPPDEARDHLAFGSQRSYVPCHPQPRLRGLRSRAKHRLHVSVPGAVVRILQGSCTLYPSPTECCGETFERCYLILNEKL